MLPNTPAMLECHYGVPMAGAVLNALNTRSDAATIAYILEHGGARVLIADSEYAPVVGDALALMAQPPIVIDVCDPEFDGPHRRLGAHDYEELVEIGDADQAPDPAGRRVAGDQLETTRRARPGIRRAWSIIIAARR